MNPSSSSTPPSSQDLVESLSLKPKKSLAEKMARRAEGQEKKPIQWSQAKGMKFGRLTVIGVSQKDSRGKSILDCQCECGGRKNVHSSSLVRGDTRSCGCLHKEANAYKNIKHQKSHFPEYKIYHGILERCFNERTNNFINYGGRGITVCERWKNSFENFFADMGKRPSAKHSIDRINNDGNYTPENCRWATRKEQGRNKRTNFLIKFNGKVQCLKDWAVDAKLNHATLRNRIVNLKWPIQKALETPVITYP